MKCGAWLQSKRMQETMGETRGHDDLPYSSHISVITYSKNFNKS
jgi:hypothetical protein